MFIEIKDEEVQEMLIELNSVSHNALLTPKLIELKLAIEEGLKDD